MVKIFDQEIICLNEWFTFFFGYVIMIKNVKESVVMIKCKVVRFFLNLFSVFFFIGAMIEFCLKQAEQAIISALKN